MTPRHLYDATALIELVLTVPSRLVLLSIKLPGIVSLCDLGKFMRPILESSNGELWVLDQLPHLLIASGGTLSLF
jgi:hypothetical protein